MQSQRSYTIASRNATFTPIQREDQAYFHAPGDNSSPNASNYALTYDLVYGSVDATDMSWAVPVDQNAFYNPHPSVNLCSPGHSSVTYQTGAHSPQVYDAYYNHPSVPPLPDANEWLSVLPLTEAATADQTRAVTSQLSYAPSASRPYEARISGSATRPSASTPTSKQHASTAIPTTSMSRPSSSGSSNSRSSSNSSSASASSAATSQSSSSYQPKTTSPQQTHRFVTVDPVAAGQSQSSTFATHSPPNIAQRLYASTSPPCADDTTYISFSDHHTAGVRLTDLLNPNWHGSSLSDYILQDETSNTATLRVWWPHQAAHLHTGLPLKNYGKNGGPITRRQLGQRIAQALRRIVEQSNEYNFEDIILVGLQRVGRGSWQPVLRVL